MKMVNRKTKEEKELKYNKFLLFLYNNILGRIILKILNNRLISKIVGSYMNSSLSKKRINKTIKNNNINMSLYEKRDFKSFNDFFTRHKINLDFDIDKSHFVSPADSKLLAIKLNKESSFDIKGSTYNLKNIINKDLSIEYQNGYALIFRLEVTDYHRYHYIDDGTRDEYNYIPGCLHTVQPIAYEKYKVFHRNAREYTVLHTKNFGDIIEVEVGAMMVGKIVNNKNITSFHKGEEKGYFEFGGSTIILFVKENTVFLDEDILFNSTLGKETIVSCGEKIGIKCNIKKNSDNKEKNEKNSKKY